MTRHFSFIGALPPYRGGISHFTTRMATGMRDRGHRVSGVTFSRQYPSLLFPGKSQFSESGADPIGAPRWIDSINPLSWRRAAAGICELAPDVVVFNYWMPFFAPAYGSATEWWSMDTEFKFDDDGATEELLYVKQARPYGGS